MTKREAVLAEARSWLRTPYHHCADIKGVGVDCAMLLVGIYRAVGLVPADLDPRPYSPDWHLHRSEEQYLGWLEQYGNEVMEPMPGDVLVWRFGRAYSHGAILLDPDGTILHAYRDAGMVVLGHWREAMLVERDRPMRAYRVHGIEEGAA